MLLEGYKWQRRGLAWEVGDGSRVIDDWVGERPLVDLCPSQLMLSPVPSDQISWRGLWKFDGPLWFSLLLEKSCKIKRAHSWLAED